MSKRENGSGTIIRRKYVGSVKYVAYSAATYAVTEGGKMKTVRYQIGTYNSRKEAREALEQHNKHPTQKFNYTLRDIYTEWKRAAFSDLQSSTQVSWTTSWTKICECEVLQLPDKLMREITTSEIRCLLDYYANERESKAQDGSVTTLPPLSKSYITKIKALMTQLCGYAMENNIIDRNYASLVKIPKMEAGKRRAFTDSEFAVLESGWATVPGGDACLVLCYTGFRVSEFCQLTTDSYDPKTRTFTGGLKTDAGRDRTVPVHPKIQAVVENWCSGRTGPLYPRPDGKAYNKDNFSVGVWKPAMKALGLADDLTPHSARHTFGTRMAAAGARYEDIQRIMGHADYAMTANTYINQDTSALIAAITCMT